jgi:hypothetical protein
VRVRDSLVRVQKGLPLTLSPELSSAVHWTPAESFPVHRWFRYREGFSPSLLDYFPNGKHRLDPFCGCGTTLLESARRGVQSYGVDLNPLATFITRVKTQAYSRYDRSEFVKLFGGAARRSSVNRPAEQPDYPLLNKLFLPNSLDTMLRLRAFIDSAARGKVHDLLLLAWLSILEGASNVFKEGNGIKYRNKRRRPGRYETLPDKEWIPRYFGKNIPGFVLRLWQLKCEQMAEDLERFHSMTGYTPEVRTGSCLDERNLDFGREMDFAVFSPPYANRFDYFEAFKIELWMGGFVRTRADMLRLRSMSMRNNLAAARFRPEMEWPLLSPFLSAMDPEASSVRMGIKLALEGYFHDMRLLLRNLRQILVKGGKVVIVVGNSAYAKSIVPTDVLIARLGQEEQYHLKSVRVARHLHVSSQQRSSLGHLEEFMRESVLVLEKK